MVNSDIICVDDAEKPEHPPQHWWQEPPLIVLAIVSLPEYGDIFDYDLNFNIAFATKHIKPRLYLLRKKLNLLLSISIHQLLEWLKILDQTQQAVEGELQHDCVNRYIRTTGFDGDTCISRPERSSTSKLSSKARLSNCNVSFNRSLSIWYRYQNDKSQCFQCTEPSSCITERRSGFGCSSGHNHDEMKQHHDSLRSSWHHGGIAV